MRTLFGPQFADIFAAVHSDVARKGRGRARKSQAIIDFAVEWFEENHPASVRACCYKLFTAGLIRDMSKNSTNNVSRLLRMAREQGALLWDYVVDESRELEQRGSWSDPSSIIRVAAATYRRDNWQDQPGRVEIWSEKGTIRGTLAPVLEEYGVGFRVMHGYSSATVMNSAAENSVSDDKPLTVFYLGDFDPSGMHMSEVDIPGRFDRYGGDAQIIRIALTPEDTKSGIPSFDADTKVKDPRYQWFVRGYGTTCWELDALSPKVLRERVRAAIRGCLDVPLWDWAVKIELAERESLKNLPALWAQGR